MHGAAPSQRDLTGIDDSAIAIKQLSISHALTDRLVKAQAKSKSDNKTTSFGVRVFFPVQSLL